MEDTQNKIAALLTKRPYYGCKKFLLSEETFEILINGWNNRKYARHKSLLGQAMLEIDTYQELTKLGSVEPPVTFVTNSRTLYDNKKYFYIILHHDITRDLVSYSVARVNIETKEFEVMVCWTDKEANQVFTSSGLVTMFDLFVHLNPEEPIFI